MGSDIDTSRLEDIKHKDEVEMIDDNRAVIKTSESENTTQENGEYTLKVELDNGTQVTSQKIKANSEEELFMRFSAWFDSNSTLNVDELFE